MQEKTKNIYVCDVCGQEFAYPEDCKAHEAECTIHETGCSRISAKEIELKIDGEMHVPMFAVRVFRISEDVYKTMPFREDVEALEQCESYRTITKDMSHEAETEFKKKLISVFCDDLQSRSFTCVRRVSQLLLLLEKMSE